MNTGFLKGVCDVEGDCLGGCLVVLDDVGEEDDGFDDEVGDVIGDDDDVDGLDMMMMMIR